MIDRNKDKPFFVAAGFFNPHCPYVAPKKYFDLYPLDQITMPDINEAKKDLEDVPPIAITRDGDHFAPRIFFPVLCSCPCAHCGWEPEADRAQIT